MNLKLRYTLIFCVWFSALHYGQCILSNCDTAKAIAYTLKDGRNVLTQKVDTTTSDRFSHKINCCYPEGKWDVFYTTGSKAVEFEIKDKKLQKRIIYYYPNGNVNSKIKIKENLREGISKHYYPNGTIRIKSHWRKDKMHGKWYFYNEIGECYNIKTYEEGDLKRQEIFYDLVPKNQDLEL